MNKLGTIYKLTFPNKKVYIGQTVQKFCNRMSQHKRNAYKACKDSNLLLYNAIRKYGWENVKKEIILQIIDLKNLTALEIEYQQKYKSCDRTNGYNIYVGRKVPKYVTNNSKSCRAIVCYDTNYNIIKIYNSAVEAENVDGFSSKAIRQCLRGKNLTHKNFIWRYQNNTENLSYRLRVSEVEKQRRASKAREKIVICYNINGSIIDKYDSVKLAAISNNYDKSNIAKCARGKKKTYKGFIWRYS